MLQKIMHKILHEIMPKTIAARAYLVTSVVVTVLMIVIGTMYADATRERIFLAEERKLIDIVTPLCHNRSRGTLRKVYNGLRGA